MAYELIPIGTFLAILTKQVIKTATAAKDVLVEKESFKVLAKYLSDIEPVLRQLQHRDLADTRAARNALESLEGDIKKANDLVEKYKNRASIYLLLKCRHIVKEVEDVTMGIGKSLGMLPLAGTEILMDIEEQFNRLHIEIQGAQFETSQTKVQIVQKLDQGLREQKDDQRFANDILEDIARAVGVPIEPSKINKELVSFKREIEEAAANKNIAEEHFLQQVIELLFRADAAKTQEEIKKHYFQRVKSIEKLSADYIHKLSSFVCPIERRGVMVDPVSLCTGITYEKAAIVAWFEREGKVDPRTGDPLDDISLRSNHLLRKSIEEWKERNYCLKIRSIKRKLQSGMTGTIVKEALVQMQEIMAENPITKDWISVDGLSITCLSILGSSDKIIKRTALMVLRSIVEGHISNKEKIIESEEIHRIVLCLGRSLDVSRPAVELLFDLLHDCQGWNLSAYRKLSEKCSAIFLYLVMLIPEVEKAKDILLKLCNDDNDNVIQAANCNWYEPLIDRLVRGPESSRISMVTALLKMEFIDLNLRCLGQKGAIRPLLEMVSGHIHSKELALSALVKLSTCRENKMLFAAAGGVPLILNLVSSQFRIHIIARCCEILENLSSNGDGTEFFVDADGCLLELDKTVTYLLAIQQNASNIIRKPSLNALLGICESEEEIVMKTVVNANGVSVILPLLDDPYEEIREVSLGLLFRFSQHDPQGITEFLLLHRRLDRLVCFLEDDSRSSSQRAAVGLLANLPKCETELTRRLIESNGIPAILAILKSGSMQAKEDALGALFRFMDSEFLESQRLLVQLGLYPLLVSILKSGTVTAKARAAALIGNLSSSTQNLTVMPKPTHFWRFMNTRKPTCEAHGAICSVESTFCILEANALPELVRLLHERNPETTYEALQALSTLVCEDKDHRGAKVLHEENVISPILEVLKSGKPSLQVEALRILEKVFLTADMVELYGASARVPLVGLTTRRIHENDQLRRKAARVLSMIQGYSRSSMPLN